VETNDAPKQQTITMIAVEATMQDKLALFMVWWTDTPKIHSFDEYKGERWDTNQKHVLSVG